MLRDATTTISRQGFAFTAAPDWAVAVSRHPVPVGGGTRTHMRSLWLSMSLTRRTQTSETRSPVA